MSNENESHYVSEWLNGKSYATTYRREFQQFVDYVNKDPDTIIKERENDFLLPPTDRKRWRYEDIAKQYYTETLKNVSPNTAMRRLSVVRSFFTFWRMNLKFRKGEIKRPTIVEPDFKPNINDIKELCQVATPRARAIILTAESSGLRVSDLVNLKRDYVLSQIEREEPPVPLEQLTKKKGVVGNPFLHKDACDAIRAYIKTDTHDSEWLFSNGQGSKMNPSAINQMLQRLIEKAQIKTPRRFRAHCLRKFCQTCLEDSNINSNIIKQIIGHKLNGSEAPYSSNHLREAFKKAQHLLMISKAQKSYEELENYIHALEAQIKSFPQAIEEAKEANKTEIMNWLREELRHPRYKIEVINGKKIAKEMPLGWREGDEE